jgi:type II secretory pathway pseudopilin PulG
MNRPLLFRHRQAGFSVLELLLSLSIFIVVSGTALSLLNSAQKRFQTEGQVLSSFQEGRLALDMIVRDVNDSGYPAANQFTAVATPVTSYAVTPVAWSPPSVNNPCAIGACGVSPGNFDLILEEFNPTTNSMQWIHYQLIGTTLFRGNADKGVAGTDPFGAEVMFPYATNVMNNAPAAQIAQINATYPGTFPGGAPVPIFTYYCDAPAGAIPPTPLCTAAGANNLATNIREVEVTLIVLIQQPDMQTKQLRLVTLNGRGHRVNPKQ